LLPEAFFAVFLAAVFAAGFFSVAVSVSFFAAMITP
jgi:hypothetical protein